MKKRHTLPGLTLLLLATTLSAQSDTPEDERAISITMADVPLSTFLELVMRYTDGRVRFLYKRDVEGTTVNVLSGRPIPPPAEDQPIDRSDLLRFTHLVLRANGFCLVPYGDAQDAWRTYEVVRSSEARWAPAPVVTPEELGNYSDAEMVTCIVPLRYADAKEIQGALKLARMSDPNVGNIVGIDSSNTISITDYAAMVRQLLTLVGLMDIPATAVERRESPYRTVALTVHAFDGRLFDELPAVATGDRAKEVADHAASAQESRSLTARLGQVLDLTGPTASESVRSENPRHRITIASNLHVEPGDPSKGIAAPSPYLEIQVNLLSGPREDFPVGPQSNEDVRAVVALPVETRGLYTFIRSLELGKDSLTLVVVVELGAIDG